VKASVPVQVKYVFQCTRCRASLDVTYNLHVGYAVPPPDLPDGWAAILRGNMAELYCPTHVLPKVS